RSPCETRRGRSREMGLGSVATLTLADAREAADRARADLHAGRDPIEARDERRAEEERARREMAAKPRFGAYAERVLDSILDGFKNRAPGKKGRKTLADSAAPLHDSPLAPLAPMHALQCRAPIWTNKPETGSRPRQRIERILDLAKADGL